MATLVLTTIGTAVGGPLGGAIGAILGQAADAYIFAPPGRKGPRLSDLRVQTSSYGTVIPRLLGRMRVSGTVIWATDLVEHRNRTGGGKGRPSTTNYSYSASFAVALSSRKITDIGRIWAEGNILRGSDGAFKSATGFRLYYGDEDQNIDPLLASAEGAAHCPAYRGIAYVVFEDMDLSPFGNRIPSLSFEVMADPGNMALSDILVDALDGPVAVAHSPAIIGAVQVGSTRREAAGAWLRLLAVQRDAASSIWQVGESTGTPHNIGEPASGEAVSRERVSFAAMGRRPSQIALGCYDPSRDFQSTVQVARVAGGDSGIERIDLPLAANADLAKRIVSNLAGLTAGASATRERPSGFASLAVPMGARVEVAGRSARLTERKIEGAQILLTLDDSPPIIWLGAQLGDGGRSISSPDLLIGSSVGHILDLPVWGQGGLGFNGGLAVAVAGTGAGWRSAMVEVSASNSSPTTPLGQATATPVMGNVAGFSSAAQAVLLDLAGWIDVELLRSDMALINVSDNDLLSGSNLAMAGGELIQFGHAEPLGNRRWRLTRLLRGRVGTEDAMPILSSGHQFTMIDGPSLLPLPAMIGLTNIGAGGHVTLTGQGDEAAIVLPIQQSGRAARPLASVHLTQEWSNGALGLRWIRRSRAGFAWPDGVDAPLDDRYEKYRITINASGNATEMTSEEPHLLISETQVAAWRATAAAIQVIIRQVGESGESLPLAAFIEI
ncbi:MAG: phage tail protein [Sphingopyxis sp.]